MPDTETNPSNGFQNLDTEIITAALRRALVETGLVETGTLQGERFEGLARDFINELEPDSDLANQTPGVDLKSIIRSYPDYPKPGIDFKDINTVLKDPAAFRSVFDSILDLMKGHKVDTIAAIESRGFHFAPAIALMLGLPYVPLRKKGGIPGEDNDKVSVSYEKEYGTDVLEMARDGISEGQNVLIMDDLIATAGTACAAC